MIFSKRGLGAIVLAAAVVAAVQGTAYAEVLEGRVLKVYPSAIDLAVYDASGRPYPNSLPVKVNSKTRLSGMSSIRNLKTNDAVGVTVRQTESRAWVADRISRFEQVNAAPATRKTPPTLREVLGNPVARGALTGAATGAIASGASGGKAGKGALIGAGVGAAAGLLEGLFSQPAQPAASSSDSSDSYR